MLMYHIETHIKKPGALLFIRLGIPPNLLTLSGILFTAIAGVTLVVTKNPGWAGLILLLGMIPDFLDGALARATDNVTDFGGWLDSNCDRVCEAIIFGCIIFGYLSGPDQIVAFAAFATAALVTHAKASAGEKGLKIDWKWKDFFGYASRAIILGIGMLGTFFSPVTLLYAIWLLALFNAVVYFERVLRVRSQVS